MSLSKTRLIRLSFSQIAFLLILMIGFWIRLQFALHVDTPLKSDMSSFSQRAVTLLEQHSFSSSNDQKGLSSSTYRPPLYPLFLASVYGLLGKDPRNAYMVQSLLGALLLIGVYQLGKSISPEKIQKQVGLTAMACGAFYPPLIAYCGILLSEMLFMTLLVWAVFCLLKPEQKPKNLLGTGLLFGLANLTRPITLPFLLLLLAALWITRQRNTKQIVAIMAIFFLTLSPWVVRNYLEFHELVLVDNSSGINLVAGNNDKAKGDYTRGYTESWMYQEAFRNSRNIVELDRRLIANTNRWIQTHPAKYMQLLLKRLGYYFVSEHEFYMQDYHWERIPWHKTELNLTFRMIFQIIAIITFIGSLFLRYPAGICVGLAGFFFYTFPAIALYYTRYRHPGIPFIFILAALGIWIAIQQWPSKKSNPT